MMSEREKQVSDTNIRKTSIRKRKTSIREIYIYIWNLEKWYRWTYLQGRNRNSDVEKTWTQQGKERVGQIDRVALKHTRHHVWNRQLVGSCFLAQGAQLSAPWWPTGCDGGRLRGQLSRKGIGDYLQLMHAVIQQKLTKLKKGKKRKSFFYHENGIFLPKA